MKDRGGVGWGGVGWAGLGWAGLGWAGLGWAGLGWAGVQGCITHPGVMQDNKFASHAQVHIFWWTCGC